MRVLVDWVLIAEHKALLLRWVLLSWALDSVVGAAKADAARSSAFDLFVIHSILPAKSRWPIA